jgi:hypothetical protein
MAHPLAVATDEAIIMRACNQAESARTHAIQPRSGLLADSRIRIIPPLVPMAG